MPSLDHLLVAVATKYPKRWAKEVTDSWCRGDYVTAREGVALFRNTYIIFKELSQSFVNSYVPARAGVPGGG